MKNATSARAHKVIGRRAVTRGAVWSVPVVAVAVAAPAAAACSPGAIKTGVLDWDGISNGNQLNKNLTTTGGTGVTVRFTVSGDTAASGNGHVTGTVTGGKSKVLRFTSPNYKKDTYQDVTITFSKSVTAVSFSLLDVDSKRSDGDDMYQDVVTLNTQPTTRTPGSNVVVGGSTAQPVFRAKSKNSPVDGSSSASNVDLTFNGPLTTIKFRYAQDGSQEGNPFIGISDIAFQYC